MNIYYAAPELLGFIEGLEPKLRVKLVTQLALLAGDPTLGEPHVKHFTIAKYSKLYELRTRSKIMVRIIFAFAGDGGIILLTPFIKRHKRNTMQALDASLKLISQLETGICSLKELPIYEILEDLK